MYFFERDDKATPETLAWTEHLENRLVRIRKKFDVIKSAVGSSRTGRTKGTAGTVRKTRTCWTTSKLNYQKMFSIPKYRFEFI